jgi:hypothetical protein
MEMMDIRAAIRWLNESCDLMTVIVKSLESQPKGETDALKQELIAAQRAAIEATLNNSIIAAILIGEQVILELPLLMGHSEDYLALVKAQGRYREESNKACAVLKNTAPVNQTAPAAPHALEPRTPADRMKELMAKARASRNAIQHGLAANIWKQPLAVRSIEQLTQLFRADGYSEQKSRLAAVAEYQTKAIRNVQCRIGEQILEAADGRGPEETLAKDLRRLQSIDRYEKRIASLKKGVFRKMQREI